MKKCAFVIPYYGKFPNYFQLFLDSCGKNPDYDWLIFTDDHTDYDYPDNVHVRYETFGDMQERAQRCFDFPISLEKPYKLCDYRPAYGLLFSDYLTEYSHWGHCDCDLIFGRLSDFITDDMLERYEKIFAQGHCSIYKNDDAANKAFMLPLNGEPIYRTVLTENRAFTFDESYLPTNVNRIFDQNGLPIFKYDLSANTDSRSSIFQLTHYDAALDTYMTERPMRAVYTWKDGVLSRSYYRLGEFRTHELMYMHLQRRRMNVDPALARKRKRDTTIQILPGLFTVLPVDDVTKDNFRTITWKHRTNHRRTILIGDLKFQYRRIKRKLFHQ